MQNNKTKFSAAVKRLIALSLATAVGFGNVPLQARAQNDDEFFSTNESSSSGEEESFSNEKSSSDESSGKQPVSEGSLQGEDNFDLFSTLYPEGHPGHNPLQFAAYQRSRFLLGDSLSNNVNGSQNLETLTEQETQQLLAIAHRDSQPQFETEPASNQAPEQNQVSTRTCLQTVISFLAWAFRPCFRGVLGSHKKD